jgi:pimeloyl-ACP methyl ester carboxylesterase
MSDPNLDPIRNDGAKAAIVFVHGFGGGSGATWGSFPKYLQSETSLDGWDIFSLGYASSLRCDIAGLWRADPPLQSVADLLRMHTQVDPLKEYSSLALIAHSMGGLVVQRALLDSDEFARRVSHVFLFGTPSAGLVKAWWIRIWKRSIADMSVRGPFVKDIRQGWAAKQYTDNPPFTFVAVAGDQDEFVPRSSSIDPFPLPQRRVVAGNHLRIVKPEKAAEPIVRLVVEGLTGQPSHGKVGDILAAVDAARAAVESREFHQVIARLEGRKADLDETGAVQLALAYEGVGRAEDAISLLQSHKKEHTDAMGVLAGRLKRRWLVQRAEADGIAAREIYAAALAEAEKRPDFAQAFYHGINVAFLDLVLNRDKRAARDMALRVLEHCKQAEIDFWCLATQGEAHLLLGETGRALESYRQARESASDLRQIQSMTQQAVLVARHMGNKTAEKELRLLFAPEPDRSAA